MVAVKLRSRVRVALAPGSLARAADGRARERLCPRNCRQSSSHNIRHHVCRRRQGCRGCLPARARPGLSPVDVYGARSYAPRVTVITSRRKRGPMRPFFSIRSSRFRRLVLALALVVVALVALSRQPVRAAAADSTLTPHGPHAGRETVMLRLGNRDIAEFRADFLGTRPPSAPARRKNACAISSCRVRAVAHR